MAVVTLATLAARALTFSVGDYKYSTTSSSSTVATVEGFSASVPSGRTYVNIPGAVTYGGTTYDVRYVGSYAFASNVYLEDVAIGYGVIEIEESAFQGCTKLTQVNLPGSMQRLQSDCFNGCTAGLDVYCAADTPPTCVDGPFDGAKLTQLNILRSCTVAYGIDSDWKKFSKIACTADVYDVILDSGKDTYSSYTIYSMSGHKANDGQTYAGHAQLVGGGNNCIVADYVTVNGKKYAVDRIDKYAFASGYNNHASSIKSVTGTINVKTIDSDAFYGCTSLSSVTGFTGLTTIGIAAFRGCSALTSFAQPATMSSINTSAFKDCSNLRIVTARMKQSQVTVASNAFESIYSRASLYVPQSELSAFQSASAWRAFYYFYGEADILKINGVTVTSSNSAKGAIVSGVSVDLTNKVVTLDGVNFTTTSTDPFISTTLDRLTIKAVGSNNITTCASIVQADLGCQVTVDGGGSATFYSMNRAGSGIAFNFGAGACLTVKDIMDFHAYNNNPSAAFQGDGGTMLTLNNTNGYFGSGGDYGIIAIRRLTLVDTKLTNCTYSTTATSYGSAGMVLFESTRSPLPTLSGDLYINGKKIEYSNSFMGAVVKGVGVDIKSATITLDNVNFTSNNSYFFIESKVPTLLIRVLGDNSVTAPGFILAESGSNVIMGGGGTGTLTTTGTSTELSNFHFGSGGGSCWIAAMKRITNNATYYPFVGNSGTTMLYITGSNGEFKRSSGTGKAVSYVKGLTLVDCHLTSEEYVEGATSYGNNGYLAFAEGDAPEPSSNKFDVNGDGSVDVGDVNAVLDEILSGGNTSKFDVNGDGNVDVGDVNAILDEILNPTTSDVETYTVGGVSFKMIKVKGGSFTMGATIEQGSEASDSEKPAHQVTLSDYWIGEVEVTEGLWKAVMGSNPSVNAKGDNYPVEGITWEQCNEFITKLNQKTGQTFRLPTEAQWEYAARGGNKSKGYKYAGSGTIGDVAWYTGNSSGAKHPVRQKAANELGLYDMSGNVWEWVQDVKGDYPSTAVTNPTGPGTVTDSGSHVQRGGSWYYSAAAARVSRRMFAKSQYDDCGLRLVK